MLLQITPTTDGFRVEGELDMASGPELTRTVVEAQRQGAPISLDFSGVSFMDSSGLRALLDAVASKNGSRPLVIVHPTPPVRRVLEISLPHGVEGLHVRD
jgi:anti-anti-sigma factor